MPMVRYQIGNEYGLSDPELYAAAEKDDPEALLEGVAMAGLVGLLRQLGDLAEFAAEIFHDLHEEVMATASRGHGLTLRLHQLEVEFPSVEKALISQISLPNVTQTEEIQWHTNVRIDQNLITRGDMPRFVMDSYEECRGPPRLFTLDKFDVAGAGACLKRYSDPSFFKTELASSYSIETEDAPRERKPRKIKKKTTRWKKGETLESLLISTSESPPSSEKQSSGNGLISRVVKLKSRRLQNSDNNARKMYHSHLLELIQSQQKIILEDSKMQSTTKPTSNGISKETSAPVLFQTENEAQKMHKVYPIQEQNEASSGSEKIGIETYSRQTREKATTDSDDMASENDNFLDALNTIELETEIDNENKSKSDPVSSSQEQMVHENFGSDSVQELVGTEKGLKLNEEIECGKATEEFFDNDDLMDVSSTSSLHSDGIHQTEQFLMSHGNNLMAVSKLPADENENVLSALEKINTVNEAQLGFEDLKCLTTQTEDHLENMDMPATDGSPETSGASDVILNLQENKLHEEIPILENSLSSEERKKYVINNKSSAGLEEVEEPLDNPVEVPQIELRNISDEILNLEEYLISTRKEESVSQDIFYYGDNDAHNHDITAEPVDVHTEETIQNFVEDRSSDPNESVQHEDNNTLEDALNGECSQYSNKEDGILPRSTASVPIGDDTSSSTRNAGFDLEALYEIRIQPNNDPTSSTSDDYIDNGRSISNPELEASSSEPHSPINILEENTIQGYPKYHMDNFIEPDEGLLDLGETKEETYRNKSLHHCEVETQSEQLNESEDFLQYLDKGESTVVPFNHETTVDSLHQPEVETHSEQLNESEDLLQYLVKDESTVLLINHETTDKSLQDNSKKNSASNLHELSVDGDDSLGVCAENPFCRNIDFQADGAHINNLELFSQNETSEMLVECVVVQEKEEGLHPADFLWGPMGSPCERMFESELVTKSPIITFVDKEDALLQTDVVLGSADNSLQYDEVGGHQISVHETEMELSYICDDNKVDGACEKTLSVEDGFAHANQEDTSVEINGPLEECKVNDEVLVENSKFEERVNSLDSAPIPFTVKDEVLVEAYKHNFAEGALPTSPVVTTEAFVTISELSEESNAKGCGLTPVAVNNEALVESLKRNEIDSAENDAAASPSENVKALVETEEVNEEVNAEGDVPTSPVVKREALVETRETKEDVNPESGVLNPFVLTNKVHVERLKANEINGAEGGVSVNNKVLVENSESKEEGDAESGLPLPLDVKSQVLVEALKINEKYSAEGDVACIEKLELNEEDNCDFVTSIPSVNHDDKLLQNKECKTEKEVSVESSNAKEESTHTGAPTPSVDHVPEILREPTNLSCHGPDTPPSSKDHECHQESVSYADLVFTTEERNITQSCTVSLDNLLYDASFSENLSEECSELHSNKPVPLINLHNDQEKLQEDINKIATDIFHKGSTGEPWSVDSNKSTIAGPSFNSSFIDKDNKVAQEGLNLEPGNTLSGSKSIDEVLVNSDLANVTVETKENELDMCSAYSLPSEHKPPPLPPLGWRMGGKLSKGTLLPTNSHASKSIDETKQNNSLQTGSMGAPSIVNHDDFGRTEAEKPRIMSLSDLPPLSCQHELPNPNLASVPISGVNVQSMEYNNRLNTAVGVTGPETRVPQYVWPDAQHAFLPVQAWNTGPSLVQGHQPGYLISLEDNLWAQYGIGPPFEDERLGRKHHSIRDMPRNPLMDAVAAHDRSTMRKVSELVKPDDKSKADERNSLLEQIRNKSFSLKPVGAPKTTSAKVPQTNLKVAAIVEKANAIRQAFVGSDEEDGDSWSDA